MTLLLDTHVLYWLSVEPERLSAAASEAIEATADLVVAAITWFELAWLAQRGKIDVDLPTQAWLTSLAGDVQTVGITPSVAATAAALPSTFPGDPADRLIYATAIEHGWQIVSKDRRMRQHAHLGPGVIW